MNKTTQIESIHDGEWEVQKHGSQTVLYSSYSRREGISVTVNKEKKVLEISGWYDSMVGIQGAELTLEQILKLFGLDTLK